MLLGRYLQPIISVGRLTVIDAGGQPHAFGPGGQPAVTIRLHDAALHWKLFIRPELAAGEAFTDGTLTVEDASLYDFLDLMGQNFAAAESQTLPRRLALRASRVLRPLQQFNPLDRAQRNAAHHYDLSGKLYELFLDADRQYSCAYFATPDDTLDEAQRNKRRHIAAKLLLQPGMHVLDIGCGWGGLGLYLADRFEACVTGVTLAEEQLKVARTRAEERRLGQRAQFFLRDYRQQTGVFDRVVSVGMFEHVGLQHYNTFFACLRDRLADNGVALLHTIGRTDGPGVTTPWIRKYIFPGGYVPALSELLPPIERAGLWVTDIEVLRLHYAETLRHWRARFLAHRDKARDLYDERFCRMWEFYLAGSEMAFRYMNQAVFQIQLAKRQDAVPLSRDYIAQAEEQLAHAEREDSLAA